MRDTLSARFPQPLKEFYHRRIIVWLDEDREFADTITEYMPDGVQLLVMEDNNRFLLRRQIEVDYAKENILLYCPLAFARDEDNWLKDVFLYSEEFRADYWSRMFDRVGIAYDVKGSISLRNQARECAAFFKNKDRVTKLAAFGASIRTPKDLLNAIFAVCCGLPVPDFAAVTRSVLLDDWSEEPNAKIAQMDKYCGEGVFWQAVEATYDLNATHTLPLLAAHILFSAATLTLDESVLMGMPYSTAQATACYALFTEWLQQDKPGLLKKCLAVEQAYHLHDRCASASHDSVARSTVFPCVDDLLLGEMFRAYAGGHLRMDDAQALISQRRDKPWFTLVKTHYDALQQIIAMVAFHQKHMDGFHYTSAGEVWKQYIKELYQMDTAYRHFFADYWEILTGTPLPMDDALKAAAEEVDKLYTNWYLEELGGRWSELLYKELSTGEHTMTATRQTSFYNNYVSNDKRTFVIISDALRYEVAQELVSELNAHLTGKAECDALQGVFPSVTWMGMAALLPHKTFTLTDDMRLLCDSMPTDNAHRKRVLEAACPESVAIDAKVFQGMTRKERGDLIHGMRVIYVYHDVIDNAGEHNESGVFTACDIAIHELVQITSILVNDLSAANVVITTDHGFLYNRAPLKESDKAEKDFVQGEILEVKRRYALVRNAVPTYETLAVNMKEFGREDITAVAPRANIRFKLQGGGAQYVHGGLSLEEICVPVVRYMHKRAGQSGFRKSEKVDVTLLGDSRKITNSMFSIMFFQKQPASDKLLPRTVKVHFEDESGKIISDRLRIVADNPSKADNERTYRLLFHLIGTSFDRMKPYLLVITDSDEQVVLDKIPFTIDIAFGMGMTF